MRNEKVPHMQRRTQFLFESPRINVHKAASVHNIRAPKKQRRWYTVRTQNSTSAIKEENDFGSLVRKSE